MAIFRLFSQREAEAANPDRIDVYQYDNIPPNLRVQINQISLEALGKVGERGDLILTGNNNNSLWAEIEAVFLREKGLNNIGRDDFSGIRIINFMQHCSTSDWLDFLELIALGIRIMGDEQHYSERRKWSVSVEPEKAIEEINYRLRRAGVGYQIEEDRLIRVDSQFIHSEIVKPALTLLSEVGFDGPRQEFLSAHEHYRAGEYRQAVGLAANALESTFKAIFDQKGWQYRKGARISDLVRVARENHLWPEYLDTSFDQLVATLQSGLPKIRDNDAAHGQGSQLKHVPAYIAAYALHLAASKIVFISEAAK
ncbi:MAG: hypothetical protein ABF572_14440 [Gluconobacter sp.]|uniref:STM4504/CBY_0614 family protein n=1 Tax=Gluconobacter sp. TaxID=1876758 RepID=UPI0039EB5A7F